MSFRVTEWVWKEAPIDNPSDMLVALVLAYHAEDDGGNAYPSVPTIAKRACLGERTVHSSLRRLIAKGVIRPEGRGFKGVVKYRLNLDTPLPLPHPAADAPLPNLPATPANPAGAPCNSGSDTPAVPAPNKSLNRSSKSPEEEARERVPQLPAPPDLRNVPFPQSKDLERDHLARVERHPDELAAFTARHFPGALPAKVEALAQQVRRTRFNGGEPTVENLIAYGEAVPTWRLVPSNVVELKGAA